MALIVLDYKFEQSIEFLCCLIPLLHGDYLWENKMMGNCIEMAVEFGEGLNLISLGKREVRPFLKCQHVLIH